MRAVENILEMKLSTNGIVRGNKNNTNLRKTTWTFFEVFGRGKEKVTEIRNYE